MAARKELLMCLARAGSSSMSEEAVSGGSGKENILFPFVLPIRDLIIYSNSLAMSGRYHILFSPVQTESKDIDLQQLRKMIEDLLIKEMDIYINVNNHYEGSAPLTIQKIQNIL